MSNDDLIPGVDYEVACCDNCGKIEHSAAELAECMDSMLGPVQLSETDSWPVPEQGSLAEQRSTERAMRSTGRRPACPYCGGANGPFHTMDTGEATELPFGCCPVLFERRNQTKERRSTC